MSLAGSECHRGLSSPTHCPMSVSISIFLCSVMANGLMVVLYRLRRIYSPGVRCDWQENRPLHLLSYLSCRVHGVCSFQGSQSTDRLPSRPGCWWFRTVCHGDDNLSRNQSTGATTDHLIDCWGHCGAGGYQWTDHWWASNHLYILAMGILDQVSCLCPPLTGISG